MEAAFLDFAFLFRYDALWQVAPAVVGALGKIGIGLPDIYLGAGGTQLGPRRVKLGIELRRFYQRQDLSAADMIADVDEPLFNVTVHPRINLAVIPGRGLARQNEVLGFQGDDFAETTSTGGGVDISSLVAAGRFVDLVPPLKIDKEKSGQQQACEYKRENGHSQPCAALIFKWLLHRLFVVGRRRIDLHGETSVRKMLY